jgi:prolyl oligopeptidase
VSRFVTLLGAILVSTSAATAQLAPPDTSDAFRWLEEMTGDRAMAWVRAENARTVAVLEKDPRFATLYQSALSMVQATDRIPSVRFIGGMLYSFWQDSTHVRGIWRRTTLASFRTTTPAWTTVLDLDALAATEKANWVWQGASCLQPAERRCLLNLSDGGEDAVTVREFDLTTRAFVGRGFSLPKGKQSVAWLAPDTLLVTREWQPGEVTASGYPYIVKKLARGRPLSTAVEVFRGTPSDVFVFPIVQRDASGRQLRGIYRGLTFFESEHYLIRATDVVRLEVPRRASVTDLIDGQVILQLSEEWKTGSAAIRPGSLVAFDLTRALREPSALSPVVVFEPTSRQSLGGTVSTRSQLLVAINDNVTGKVLSFTRTAGGWSRRAIALPENVSTVLQSAEPGTDQVLIQVTGFLTPNSLWLVGAGAAPPAVLKTLAPRFDASRHVVRQYEATSKDGTRVPYFIVHPTSIVLNGSTPTILEAYGGFEISNTPRYDADVGKLWLEQGGAYVLANIRGGGEFGPAWHQAGLKTRRQVIYDDFLAVAQDLITRRVTSSSQLGIVGGSNGGLLMGVVMTQRPDLFGAVDIAVPLLDMLRFEQIAAGASWVAEYGSVSVPEERAFLASISPLHNLRPGVAYPEPLVWTTTKDDRVGPQHARKFAAKMAAMGLPYLFYEVTEGGHGSGANLQQSARTTALQYTYFARRLFGPARGAVP